VLGGAALGAGALLGIYLYAGFALPGDVGVMRHSSGLYDMDVPRVVADVTTSLRAYRTGVHPLQKLLLAPVGQWVNVHVFDGGNRLAAAKVLIAVAMTLNAFLVGVLAWQLARRSLPAGLLAGALCGVSFSSLLAATIPESAAFSCLATVVPLVVLNARAGKPFTWGEAVAWAGIGVLGFGITITQVTHAAIALAVRLTALRGERTALRGEAEEATAATLAPRVGLALGLAALAIGLGAHAQSALYPRSTLFWEANPLDSERSYLRVDELAAQPLRHTTRLLGHFALYDFAAPAPAFSDYLIREFDHDYWSISIEESGWSDWRPLSRALVAVFVVAFVGVCGFLCRGDARFLAPVLSLASQFGIHLLYGREYVLYSPNWHGVLVAVGIAGAWNGLAVGRPRLIAAGAILCAALLASNLGVLGEVHREFGAGLEAAKRDASGRLLER
jgi:hypothetical protein